jgi:hypothetical protein
MATDRENTREAGWRNSARVRTRRFVRLATIALVAGGLSVAGFSLTAGTAEAQHGPVPLGAWPGCPDDHPEGPCHWCPGDPPVQTGNLRVNPVIWDNGVCHTYWYVYFGQGNVAQNIWEGDVPPSPPPPPPPAIISTYEQCQQIFGIFCPKA